MKIFIETERLILREIEETDLDAMFELDSNPHVHKFLGNRPVKTLDEAKNNILLIRKQYKDNGIGRWAVIDKKTNAFLGWSGFKLITEPVDGKVNYYDLGYRFLEKHWGKGYAYEAALSSVNYASAMLKLNEIFAMAATGNEGSNHILQKLGFTLVDNFQYIGLEHNWYRLKMN